MIETVRPKTRLIRTELSATINVSRSACGTFGSANASCSAVNPFSNVFVTTSDTGHAIRPTRYSTTSPRRRSRIDGDVLTTTRHPPLEDVEHHEHGQRHAEQHRGDHRGAREVV